MGEPILCFPERPKDAFPTTCSNNGRWFEGQKMEVVVDSCHMDHLEAEK